IRLHVGRERAMRNPGARPVVGPTTRRRDDRRTSDRARARRRMASARIMTKRRALGQHFLRDSTIARAIVEVVAPTERDLVVEVGPGDGALTGLLAGRAGRVLALEVDR